MSGYVLMSRRAHAWGAYLPEIFGAGAVIVLATAIRTVTIGQLPAAFVAAIVTAILDPFSVYLNPIGEVPITGVIAIPTLVLFGWQAAVIGATAAAIPAFFYRPRKDALVSGSERLLALAAAAAAVMTIPRTGPYGDVRAVAAAAVAAAALQTAAAAIRMRGNEGIAWLRALRYLVAATSFHHLVVMIVAGATVLIIMNDTSTVDRLLVPVVAAAVTLQLYLPRILRGQEQRRVLAAVSVLAAAVDAKDPYTADHSASVARLCRRVARILGMDEPEVHKVYLAALLHDVGKTVVPPEILRKPGPLTTVERDVVRSHVEAGVRIVRTIRGLTEVAPIVAASHERVDGTGYPQALPGPEVPLPSRIILAVDAYNALTTDRTYRAARSPAAALQELEAFAGAQFDPRVIAALREAVGLRRTHEIGEGHPAWMTLLRQPAFMLLWVGEMVSFVGDNIFFIALTLWVLKLTGSATMLAATLVAATVGQGLLGLFAGALADRMDRRGLIVATDVCRALIVATLPLVLPWSIPGALALLLILNVGTVFFRTAVLALMPTVVPREDLATATALFQTTQRIAETIGYMLGGAVVVAVGFPTAFYLDAATFVVSAVCVGLMPVVWRAGLGTAPPRRLTTEIGEGLRYIWQTPIHRVLALLILPGYLTLAFDVLQTPMVVKTAGLSAIAYGVINGASGIGKLTSATALIGAGKRWVGVPFTVGAFLLTALAVVLFGSTTQYPVLIATAFFVGLGNVATNIANASISLANVPSELAGRLMASRQVFIAGVTVIGMLVFGRLADALGPPVAIAALGLVSGVGVFIVWLIAGRQLQQPGPAEAPGGEAD